MTQRKKISPILFAATLVCFLFPFVTVSCSGQKMASFNGVQLAMGTTVDEPQMFGPSQKKKQDPEPLAAVALVGTVLALGLSFLNARAAIGPAISAGVSALSLILLKSKLDHDVQQAHGVIQLNYEAGFSLSLLLLIAGASWNVYLCWQTTRLQAAGGNAISQSRRDVASPPTSVPTIPAGPSPGRSVASIICPHCGAYVKENANFCFGCGKPLSNRSAAVVPSQSSVPSGSAEPALSVPPKEVLGRFAESKQRPSSAEKAALTTPTEVRFTLKTTLILSGIVLLVLLAAGAVWYLRGVQLTVISEPPAAQVYIDTQFVGKTNDEGGHLKIGHISRGQHSLMLKREGYAAWIEPLQLSIMEGAKEIRAELRTAEVVPATRSAPILPIQPYKPFDSTNNKMNIIVAKSDLGSQYHLDVDFTVPLPPAANFQFNLITIYGTRVSMGKRSDLPASTFPSVAGNWKPGEHVTFRVNVPKQFADPSQGWDLRFCVGSPNACIPSPNLLTGAQLSPSSGTAAVPAEQVNALLTQTPGTDLYLPAESCTSEPLLRSSPSSTSTSIEFQNNTAESVSVYWLDFNGQRKFYKALAPSETYLQSTFVGHPWLVSHADGQCLAMFLAAPSASKAEVHGE